MVCRNFSSGKAHFSNIPFSKKLKCRNCDRVEYKQDDNQHSLINDDTNITKVISVINSVNEVRIIFTNVVITEVIR